MIQSHQYWRNPTTENSPTKYLIGKNKSLFLVSIMKKYVPKKATILEIGCNIGRNVHYLYVNGYKNVVGIEINSDAVDLLYFAYPNTAGKMNIINDSVEEIIPKLHDESFDVVFTMAVLEHLSLESEFVFSHIIRITKNVILTIEDEFTCSSRHFPRNYRKIFEINGIKHLEINTNNVEGISSPNFHSRLFIKKPFI